MTDTRLALDTLRLRLTFSASEPLSLPPYTGSLWRGILGHGLRRVACSQRRRNCDGCPGAALCPYPRAFGTPPIDAGARYATPPRPYVIRPRPHPERITPDQPFGLDLTLIGPAADAAHSYIQALDEGARSGLGHRRTPAALTDIQAEHAPGDWRPLGASPSPELPSPPSAPERIRVELHSPLRLKRGGRLVTANEFDGALLTAALLFRLHLLQVFFGLGAPAEADASGITVERAELWWHDWQRWSNRQRTHQKLGGLLGRIELSGTRLEALWPQLWWGQWLHIGAGVTFGLGSYTTISLTQDGQ